MKLPFLSILMEALDRLDGLSGILQRIWFFITLPFVALFSGLYAAVTEAGRLFAQGPFRAIRRALSGYAKTPKLWDVWIN